MVHITLFVPDSAMPQEYDVESYGIREGVLYFRVKENAAIPTATDISTTVPFLIRQQVEKKK